MPHLVGIITDITARHIAEEAWQASQTRLSKVLELADAEYLRTDAEIQLAGGQFALSRARAVLGRLLAESS